VTEGRGAFPHRGPDSRRRQPTKCTQMFSGFGHPVCTRTWIRPGWTETPSTETCASPMNSPPDPLLASVAEATTGCPAVTPVNHGSTVSSETLLQHSVWLKY